MPGSRPRWFALSLLLAVACGCTGMLSGPCNCDDAGEDAGTWLDAGLDAGDDAGTSVVDAGVDAGSDSGVPDAGNDGGTDAGADAGSDAGTDAGTPPNIGNTCIGDDVADDTVCLQRFIDEAVAAAKPLVFPPSKHYRISNHLYVGGALNIEGSGSTLRQTVPHIMLMVGASQVTVARLTFDYQANAEYAGLVDLQPNISNVVIDTCTFLGAKALAGVHINNPGISYVTVKASTFTGVVYGVLTNVTNFTAAERAMLAKHPHHLTIDGNTMTGLTGDGVEINSPVFLYAPYGSGTPGVAAHDIAITNNIIRAPASDRLARGFCIGLAGATDVEVTGNTLEDCKWQAVHLEDRSTRVTISTNQMRRIVGNRPSDITGWSSNRSGIIALDSRQISILGNTVEATVDEGIDVTYDGVTFNQGFTIAGNTIADAGRYGIFVGGLTGQDLMTRVGPSGTFGGNTSTGALGPINVAAGSTGVTVTGNVNF